MCGCCPLLGVSVRARLRGLQQGHRLEPTKYRLRRAVARCRDEDLLCAALRLLEACRADHNEQELRITRLDTFASIMNSWSQFDAGVAKFGMDIGGTLVKCALLAPASSSAVLPEKIGESGRVHRELVFSTEVQKSTYKVHFMCGDSGRLDQLLQATCTLHEKASKHALKVVATGGGAHRLAAPMRETFNIEMMPFGEMNSLVSGLRFLHEYGPKDEVFSYTRDGREVASDWPEQLYPCLLVCMGSGVSILRIDKPGTDRACAMSPAASSDFTRMGGTACGGASFLGLAKLLSSATTFQQALELAKDGDPRRVNKLVSDIYGQEGSASLGLPGELTAAYFGKLTSKAELGEGEVAEADVMAALLMMVVQGAVILANAFAQQVQLSRDDAPNGVSTGEHSPAGKLPGAVSIDEDRPMTRSSSGPCQVYRRRPPVFFVGGFLARNVKAQKLIATTYWKLNFPPALFLRHAEYLGALGALGSSLA